MQEIDISNPGTCTVCKEKTDEDKYFCVEKDCAQKYHEFLVESDPKRKEKAERAKKRLNKRMFD